MEGFESFLQLSSALADSTMAGEPSTSTSGKALTRVAGGLGKRRAKAQVVAHGHASQETCETVFRQGLSAWGLSGTTEGDRDELKWALAEVMVHGTSAEISWETVTFQFKGDTLTMAPFVQTCANFIGYTNPLRVWGRDYNRAEIPLRISALLADPENVELRQIATANYGTTMDNAKYCFDLAHALSYSGMVMSHSEIMLINRLSASVINRANDDAVMRGFAQATSNHADTVGDRGPVKQASPVTAAPPAERSKFAQLR